MQRMDQRVTSRIEDLSPVVKKVSVELAPDRVKDALETAYTSVSKSVKLKGYRQGNELRDYASCDYEGFIEGAPLRGAKREGTLLEVVPGSLLENKAEGLLGARVGETRELGVTFPSDYAAEDLRGKEARFQVVV